MVERLPSGVLIDFRRPDNREKKPYHVRTPRCGMLFDDVQRFIHAPPASLRGYDFIVMRCGDGGAGLVIDKMLAAKKDSGEDVVIIWEEGGNAMTLFNGLLKSRAEKSVPISDCLRGIFPQELYQVIEYYPPQLTQMETRKQRSYAYLFAADHATVATIGFEGWLHGKRIIRNPRARYEVATILSAGTIFQRLKPNVIYWQSGKEQSIDGEHTVSSATVTVPNIATYSIGTEIPDNQVMMVVIRAENDRRLFWKYAKIMYYIKRFKNGADMVVNNGLVETIFADEVIIYPDQRGKDIKRPNASIDGERLRLDEPIDVKRGQHKIIFIIPNEVVESHSSNLSN